HVLRRLGRGHDDGDVARLLGEVCVQVADVADHETVPAGADFLRVLVVDRGDVEAALPKAGILYQRAADAACTDEHDTVGASQVQGEPPHGALGDLPHCELFHNRTLQRKSRTNISGPSVSGRAAGSTPSAASPAVTTAAERPVAAITTLRSCLRRRVKQAVTNA